MNDETERIFRAFCDHQSIFSSVREAALRVRRLIEDISPLIESHTSVVCQECRDVCCRNRHSYHDKSDIIYMAALGRKVDNSGIADNSAPCRFMSDTGCTLMRSERPFRCNWFFCGPLLDHMACNMGPRKYRDFNDRLSEITLRRLEMIKSYEATLSDPAIGSTGATKI